MPQNKAAGFGAFILSLLPLVALVGIGLGALHLASSEMPLVGAILLTFLSVIPLSIGPVFLMLVAFGKGETGIIFPLAIAFNRLRLILVLPIFVLVLSWIGERLPDIPTMIWTAAGMVYFALCLWLTTKLVRHFLPFSPLLSALIATGALCLAVL